MNGRVKFLFSYGMIEVWEYIGPSILYMFSYPSYAWKYLGGETFYGPFKTIKACTDNAEGCIKAQGYNQDKNNVIVVDFRKKRIVY